MAERMLILITGVPGIGKTTIIQRIFWDYKSKTKVGGILTREVREKGKRVGFRILDLESNREGWLARWDFGNGPMVGKYTVNVQDLDDVGTGAIERAIANRSVSLVLLDEIGPMEMASPRFRNAVMRLFDQSEKPVVATFKLDSEYPVVNDVLKEKTTVRLEVKADNREITLGTIRDLLEKWKVGVQGE